MPMPEGGAVVDGRRYGVGVARRDRSEHLGHLFERGVQIALSGAASIEEITSTAREVAQPMDVVHTHAGVPVS
jgi:hypothetical protein